MQVQFGIELSHIWRCQWRVVTVRERPAAGLHRASGVITHGLELPDGANALEVAHVGAVGQMHAVHVGVDKSEGEFAQWVA